MSEDQILKPGLEIRPKITTEDCKSLLLRLYGFKCEKITELDSYDDKNYKINVSAVYENKNVASVCSDGYVLKILNSLDSKNIDFVKAQSQLLMYLERSSFVCPVMIPNVSGNFLSLEKLISGEHVVRLMKYIPGEILHKVPTSPNLFYQVGQYVANLDMAMKDFNHPAYKSHKTVWMLDSLPDLRKFLYVIDDAQRWKIVESIINDFEERVLNKENNLEKGIIHGDCNEQNFVVENVNDRWLIKSILDFGDSHYSRYVFELAITMTYMMILGKDLDVGGYVIAGYSKVRRIPYEEIQLLKVCVEARLCQSLVLGAYSSKQDPNNTYILTTSKPGWELLLKINSLPDDEVLKRWKFAADMCENKCHNY